MIPYVLAVGALIASILWLTYLLMSTISTVLHRRLHDSIIERERLSCLDDDRAEAYREARENIRGAYSE